MLQSIWIPDGDGGFDYKAVGKCTAEDFYRRADYTDRLIAGIVRHNSWVRAMGDQIVSEGVTTASELAHVPTLDEPAELPVIRGELAA